MKKIFYTGIFCLFGLLSAQAQLDEVTVRLNKPDAKGNTTFDIVDKAGGAVVTQRYRIDEGTIDIFLGEENTGYLEVSPNSNKLSISDLAEGERLEVASLKLTSLESMAVLYISKVPLTIPK